MPFYKSNVGIVKHDISVIFLIQTSREHCNEMDFQMLRVQNSLGTRVACNVLPLLFYGGELS